MVPAPLLVGIELNPGPALSKEKRQNIILLNQLGESNKAIAELKSALKKLWKNLDMEHVIASINSLPRRFQECIDLKGARTSY